MALPVNSNISSLNAQRNLQTSTNRLSKSLERLSSGMRINRAGDDAAGLAISEGLRSQIRGLDQAVRNSNDGLSLIGTAEGAINSYTDILQRVRELSVQSANDTNSASNRTALNQEVTQLLAEAQRIATTVSFNGRKLLDGSFTSMDIQAGAMANQTIGIDVGNLQTNAVGRIAHFTTGSLPTANPLGAGDLVINGVNVSATTSDGVSTANASGSAIAIANSINEQTASHGVRADVLPAELNGVAKISDGVSTTLNGTTEQLTINNVDIFDGSITISSGDSTSSLLDAINSKANATGVTASVDNTGKLILTANDGRNIDVVTTGDIGDELGLLSADGNYDATTGGKLRIVSDEPISISGSHPAYAGFTETVYAIDDTTAINRVNVSTKTGATDAIMMVDNALDSINKMRAGLGAITNRLEYTIQNLQTISENLSASESRIRDADFAVETANLSKNQILQQAGISILSQANASTQSALSLLQG